MLRKVYCACDSDFRNYYHSQTGNGLSDISVFHGSPYQRGYGFGSLFKRFGIPVLKFLGKHVLKTGVDIGQDVLNKKNIKDAFKERAKVGIKEVAGDSLNKLSNYFEQQGKGLKRKQYKKTVKKARIKKDIFSS